MPGLSQSHIHPSPPVHSALIYPCGWLGCRRYFKMLGGRTRHIHAAHPILSPPPTPQHPSSQSSPSLHSPSPPPVDTNPSTNIGDAVDGDPPHGKNQTDLDSWDREEFDLPNRHSSPPSNNHGPQEPPTNLNTQFFGPGDRLYRHYHPKLTARPCNERGEFLASGTPPLVDINNTDDWSPCQDQVQFETAEFLFSRCQMSAPKINVLLDLWESTLYPHNAKPPFNDHRHMSKTIDATTIGDVKWQSFSASYTGEIPAANLPPWMLEKYHVWFRDPRQVVRKVLGNLSFTNEMDLSPFEEYSTKDQIRHYKDFMSSEWAWQQADIISEDERTDGSTFVPIVLCSDKTTVSVATGNNEYYPLYLSIGNVQNNVRCAHRDVLVLIGFLAIPKTTKEHTSDTAFRKFCRQLFHSSLSVILQPLKPAMTTPKVAKFGDGHFWRVIYGLGPYIADYEEQALLACIVRGWCARFGNLVPFTNDFPCADIHQLIAPDILHQLIKGCFKDHLVDWATTYIRANHSKREADCILDDIDRSGFKEWTSDNSKALMKVYIAAIEGYVPMGIVHTFCAFLKFCYLKSLEEIEDALSRFHTYREVFRTDDNPIVTTFSLPCQHSAKHYPSLIRLFSAPNGLCLSITKCKHIKAYQALGQMLLTNQWLNKLTASHVHFTSRGMMNETCMYYFIYPWKVVANPTNNDMDTTNNDANTTHGQHTASVQADNDISVADNSPTDLSVHAKLARTAQRRRPHTVSALAEELCIPNLSDLLCHFLFDQIYPNHPGDRSELPLAACPRYGGRISTFNSACSRFYVPSDLSGIGGMNTEFICSTPLWRNEGPR
ncbi:hypothetical protein BDN67DRAFT_991906 [Paxillus ammoniavirescens]|nr:hypothetical protein BDN67DRAFT_991906 [Paxillus ammoniavirescens]